VGGLAKLPRGARAYTLAVIATGLVLPLCATALHLGPHSLPRDTPWLLLSLFAAALATESRPTRTAVGPQLTVVSALFIAAFLLTGGVIGPLAVCAGSATVEVLQRRPLVRVAFNAAQYLVSTTAAATVYELLVERLGADWHVALLDIRGTPVLGASIGVYFLLNSGLVAGVIALSRGLSFWQVWQQAQQDIRVQYLAMVALGILMAMLWPRAPWTWLLVGLVVAVVHLSFAQAAHLQQRTEELAAAWAESDRLRSMAEQRLRRVAMVYRSSVELVGAQQDDTVPRVLADIAARAFGFDAVVVCLYEPAQASPRVAAAWSILPADERAVLRLVRDPWLTERLREGEAWYALQEADGRRAGAAGLHGVKAAAPPTEEAAVPWPVTTVLPLLAGEHLFGMLVAGYLTARDLDLHDRQLLSMLAHQGAQALLRLKLGREASEVETLRQVDRARTQVLATVSHELRSPLTAVAGYSELLCSEDLSPQEVRETAWHIAAGARRLLYLVEDITTFYRLGSAAFRIFPERLEVVPLLEEALALARPAASATRHQFVLDVDLDRPLPDVYADRVRVLQILANLLNNAVKFSPPGSTVRLGAHAVRNQIVFEVEDHGTGIAPEDLARIFEPFYRTAHSDRQAIQGTGLGLAIVKRLVELQNGSIEVRSTVGLGSTFIVRLRAATADLSGSPPVQPGVRRRAEASG
jgi:signal transduction histidine kinase